MRLLILAVLLVPSLALGQGVNYQPMLPGWGASSPVLERYLFAPSGATVTTSTRGTPLTVTGPATTVCDPSRTPQCWTAPADTLAVGPSGALVYGARTSRVLNNQRSSANTAMGGMLAATWSKVGAASVAPGCVIAPDGSCTADCLTVSGAFLTNTVYSSPAGFTAGAALATSVWIKRVTTTGTLRIWQPTTEVYGNWNVGLASLPDAWVPLWAGSSLLAVAAPFKAHPTTGAGGMAFSSGDGAPITVCTWRPWQHEGAKPTPDAEVGAAPLSVAETTAAIPIPPGAQPVSYTVDGVRQTADVSALASPLIVGGSGPLGPINGALLDLVFCLVPGGCQ